MLPEEVVESMFEFIDVGEGIGKLPVDFVDTPLYEKFKNPSTNNN